MNTDREKGPVAESPVTEQVLHGGIGEMESNPYEIHSKEVEQSLLQMVSLIKERKEIVKPPEPNFVIVAGDDDIVISFNVRRTLRNRIKYWLFCQFFPFRIKRWDKEIE